MRSICCRSCPWINQCVGLNNERYFVLFLLYFAVGCGCVGAWGWRPVFSMLKLDDDVSPTCRSASDSCIDLG